MAYPPAKSRFQRAPWNRHSRSRRIWVFFADYSSLVRQIDWIATDWMVNFIKKFQNTLIQIDQRPVVIGHSFFFNNLPTGKRKIRPGQVSNKRLQVESFFRKYAVQMDIWACRENGDISFKKILAGLRIGPNFGKNKAVVGNKFGRNEIK